MEYGQGSAKPSYKITDYSEKKKYIASEDNAAYPPTISDIRNTSSEVCKIVQIEKPKPEELVAGAEKTNLENHTFRFTRGIRLRGASVCIKRILSQYSNIIPHIHEIEDFQNGIAQAHVFWVTPMDYTFLR